MSNDEDAQRVRDHETVDYSARLLHALGHDEMAA